MRAVRILFVFAISLLPVSASGVTYYVRQTVGDDTNDGKSPESAWKNVQRLSKALRPGDIAYVGPGLYRGEGIQVLHSGTPEKRITLIADTSGQHTGDPPGIVMITGAEPVDEKAFVRVAPRVYKLRFTRFRVAAVVEMDSNQARYARTEETRAHLIEKLSELDSVKKLPGHMFHDQTTKDLYVHFKDDRPPTAHEIEVVRYGNGISTSGQHHVTVIGFTLRHVGDAGINFFKGSGDVIAIGNTSWGSRQGIRVYGATNVLLQGNTLFRNENSGAYFALKATNAAAIGNISYENVKGLRWSSDSSDALAIDNVLFENREAGLSFENVSPAVARGNRLVNNKRQIQNVESDYSSDRNCFESASPDDLVAMYFPYRSTEQYRELEAHQEAHGQDLGSRVGGCGALPEKIDVHKVHAETLGYLERAKKILASRTPRPTVTPVRRAPGVTPTPAKEE